MRKAFPWRQEAVPPWPLRAAERRCRAFQPEPQAIPAGVLRLGRLVDFRRSAVPAQARRWVGQAGFQRLADPAGVRLPAGFRQAAHPVEAGQRQAARHFPVSQQREGPTPPVVRVAAVPPLRQSQCQRPNGAALRQSLPGLPAGFPVQVTAVRQGPPAAARVQDRAAACRPVWRKAGKQALLREQP